jgi:hypothetical protein
MSGLVAVKVIEPVWQADKVDAVGAPLVSSRYVWLDEPREWDTGLLPAQIPGFTHAAVTTAPTHRLRGRPDRLSRVWSTARDQDELWTWQIPISQVETGTPVSGTYALEGWRIVLKKYERLCGRSNDVILATATLAAVPKRF